MVFDSRVFRRQRTGIGRRFGATAVSAATAVYGCADAGEALGNRVVPAAPTGRVTAELRLNRRWMIGDPIGQGTFGRVYEARSDQGQVAAAKLVPYGPAANTQFPQVDLQCVRNVVQVIDSGRHGEHFVMVMQKAVQSLRELMDLAHSPIPAQRVLRVLRHVALALVDLDGRVIHRDIKPANVLRVDGHWCRPTSATSSSCFPRTQHRSGGDTKVLARRPTWTRSAWSASRCSPGGCRSMGDQWRRTATSICTAIRHASTARRPHSGS
jgi:hypothetical protein